MEIKLKKGGENLPPIEKILYLRGTDLSFFHPDQKNENDPYELDHIENAARRLLTALVRQENVYVQIDSDCDGYTSAALLLNYMHDLAPATVENHWTYGLHNGKMHGIDTNCITEKLNLIIAPDSSSNESDLHINIAEKGIDIIVLDHHEADHIISDPAIIVNNQMCNYPNKALSGVGIVYKVCQVMDKLQHRDYYCYKWLDLVALGLLGDMMDMRSPETNYYIQEGLQNVSNPFFVYLAEKNDYLMKGRKTPHSISWYIAPFINAVTRVGSQEDKLLIFESMLPWKAQQLVPSDKRGAKFGDEELRVVKAIRHATNIKRHQDDDKKALIDEMEQKIKQYNLLQDPILIVQNKHIDDDDPIRGITGLTANALMSKYNKPTLILNELIDKNTGETIWSGSGRGLNVGGINNWREYIENTKLAIFAQGHAMAFGVAFTNEGLKAFKEKMRQDFGTIVFEPTYEVDYTLTMHDDIDTIVSEIGQYKDYWGQGVPEPLIAIQHIHIDGDVVANLLSKGTLRIDLKPYKTSIIKFGSTIEEYQSLLGQTISVVGTCQLNTWNGHDDPQLELIDYYIETVPTWAQFDF